MRDGISEERAGEQELSVWGKIPHSCSHRSTRTILGSHKHNNPGKRNEMKNAKKGMVTIIINVL